MVNQNSEKKWLVFLVVLVVLVLVVEILSLNVLYQLAKSSGLGGELASYGSSSHWWDNPSSRRCERASYDCVPGTELCSIIENYVECLYDACMADDDVWASECEAEYRRRVEEIGST